MSKVINFNEVKDKFKNGVFELLDILGYEDKSESYYKLADDLSLVKVSKLELDMGDFSIGVVTEALSKLDTKSFILTDGIYYELVFAPSPSVCSLVECATIANIRANLDKLKLKNLIKDSYNPAVVSSCTAEDLLGAEFCDLVENVALGLSKLLNMYTVSGEYVDSKRKLLNSIGIDTDSIKDDSKIDALFTAILAGFSSAVYEPDDED